MDEQTPQRQTACIVKIADIKHAQFVSKEGWDPSYLKAGWGEKIYRLHLVGTVIEKRDSPQSLIIDDGSASISVRSFDPFPRHDVLTVGSIVRIIGKPRVYNDQVYIVPEIVIPLDSPWLKLHQAYVKYFDKCRPQSEEPVEEVKHEDLDVQEDPNKQFLAMIDALDAGEGVKTEEVKEKLKGLVANPDQFFEQLLLHGEIFEIRPGMVKVLK